MIVDVIFVPSRVTMHGEHGLYFRPWTLLRLPLGTPPTELDRCPNSCRCRLGTFVEAGVHREALMAQTRRATQRCSKEPTSPLEVVEQGATCPRLVAANC